MPEVFTTSDSTLSSTYGARQLERLNRYIEDQRQRGESTQHAEQLARSLSAAIDHVRGNTVARIDCVAPAPTL